MNSSSAGNGDSLSRRHWLAATAALAGAAASSRLLAAQPQAGSAAADESFRASGERINQSVVKWCFAPMDIETLARAAAGMGCKSVELCPPSEWPVLKQYGLTCAIASTHTFVRGLNDPANHPECLEKLTAAIDASADFGCPNVITFSGMRNGLSDEEGIANTVAGVKKMIGLAEQKKVNICLEPLNTRVDVEMKGHPGYQCDTVEWAVKVCDQVGSPRMKILFDIYHVQIMQGDVITRLRQYKDYIAHYHTAGNPGRRELDDEQEINYPGIVRAIAETGYTGFVGQEFIPTWDDKLAALRHAVKLCDV